ncbi:MAG: GTP cyclohydrolase I [Desulfurococcaceae archaeon TW002]
MVNEKDLSNRFEKLKNVVRDFIKLIGDDPDRPELKDTPERVARMWLEELASGYEKDPDEHLKYFYVNSANYVSTNRLVAILNIPVRSMCEHHLLPFYGSAYVVYVPSDEVFGLSKFARVVDVFARKLQLQERLTEEVADYLFRKLKTKGLLVMIEAIHTCALIRGVEEPLSMVTLTTRGELSTDNKLREEALKIIRTRKPQKSLWLLKP